MCNKIIHLTIEQSKLIRVAIALELISAYLGQEAGSTRDLSPGKQLSYMISIVYFYFSYWKD